jgi:hypothetical protein
MMTSNENKENYDNNRQKVNLDKKNKENIQKVLSLIPPNICENTDYENDDTHIINLYSLNEKELDKFFDKYFNKK